MRALVCLLLVLFATPLCAQTSANDAGLLLTNVRQVVDAVIRRDIGRRFEFTARVAVSTGVNDNIPLAVADETGPVTLLSNRPWSKCPVTAGDLIHVRGYVDVSQFCPACARVSKIQPLAPGTPPPPVAVTGEQIVSGAYDNLLVLTEGTVRDVFFDDIDPNFCALVLDAGTQRILAIFSSAGVDGTKLDRLLNARVSIVGLCQAFTIGSRRTCGRHLCLDNIDDIRLIEEAKDAPFDTPNLEELNGLSGEEISRLGRRRVFGKVIAAWGKGNFLVNHANRKIVRVEVARGESPSYGDVVEAVGFIETDLYHVNLSRAVWRNTRPRDTSQEPIEDVKAVSLLRDELGRAHIQSRYHGRTIRICGTVRSLSSPQSDFSRITVDDNGVNVPVDVSALPEVAKGLEIGCQVSVSGVCVIEIENWRPNAVFPRIKGFFLVPRRSGDLVILSRPSWWTPQRLSIALFMLGILLISIILWNHFLRKMVEKRSRELTDETVARVTSELKVGERTRLAMELHDSIVQSLTGISMEIRTADRISEENPHGMHEHLSLAIKTLDACRKDLRNCLWDLRNLTLEDEDVNDAIQKTLAPHVGDAKLSIRFNVPREMFLDNTAYTILRIIRELAVNAIQHGKATSLRIAGSIEGHKLLFSVKDNGCGFDPERIPGMRQGHFGIQGIRDRIATFDGELFIQSSPGSGAKVTVSINLPSQDDIISIS